MPILSIKNFKRSATGDDELEVAKKDELETSKRAGELGGGKVKDAEVVAAKKHTHV